MRCSITAAAFAVLSLVSWNHNRVGQSWPPVHNSAVQCGTIALQLFQQPLCQHCFQPLGPGSAASTTPLTIRFTSFAGGGENFAAACLIAAHCIFIRNLLFICVDSNQRCSVFCGARTLVCSICRAARILHESILSKARIVSAFSVVLCCTVCAPSPREDLTRRQIAHV